MFGDMSEREIFRGVTTIVSDMILDRRGHYGTCLLSSHVLAHVLSGLDFPAYPLRVYAIAGHKKYKTVTTIGFDNPAGFKTPAGEWSGHMCVAVGTQWLLDPTLPQANRPEWGRDRLPPLVIRLPDDFWMTPSRGARWEYKELQVAYFPYPRPQWGFKSKSDARPSHWRPIAEHILEAMKTVFGDDYDCDDDDAESEEEREEREARLIFGNPPSMERE